MRASTEQTPVNSSTRLTMKQVTHTMQFQRRLRVLGKILITKPIFPEAMDFLKSRASVDGNMETRALSRSELVARLQGKQGALTQLTDVIDREVLETIPDIRILCNIAVGFNNVDID